MQACVTSAATEVDESHRVKSAQTVGEIKVSYKIGKSVYEGVRQRVREKNGSILR